MRVLTVRTRKDVTEKYGRYLADLIAGEVNLNQALVAAGHAVPAEY
ncbi:MAG: thermonuclease family protein [Planctomycetaceae bacterium]